MNVVDSSAWLEYFADGPNADFFAPAVEAVDRLLVPAVCCFEVFKKILRERGEGEALQAAALMRQGRVVPLDEGLALEAAKLSLIKKLPMADSIVLATAWSHRAVLWTQDADFEGMEPVQFKRRP
ncbi:type II toxin-antitoxin system VapC family toxin [Deltaproteobacteria bacterium PRO3]|nr:type II toxin-antitoxin system VapC family toxin [Deltaproteobacteria bacterium PRO3]